MVKKINYNCKQNDVELKFIIVDNEIDEVWVRVKHLKSEGWTVVGFEDLKAALEEVQGKLKTAM